MTRGSALRLALALVSFAGAVASLGGGFFDGS